MVEDNLKQVIDFLGQRKYESELALLARQDPEDVFSWTTAREMSTDPLMKNYYLQQMMKCIRRNGGVNHYLKGIFYTHDVGKKDLNKRLSDEMIEKHPILGRLLKFYFCYRPLCLLYNPFD